MKFDKDPFLLRYSLFLVQYSLQKYLLKSTAFPSRGGGGFNEGGSPLTTGSRPHSVYFL